MDVIKTVQVKDLKAGDNLGNCLILADPIHIGDYCGQKNRVSIRVRFKNGTESTRIWGAATTIKMNTRISHARPDPE